MEMDYLSRNRKYIFYCLGIIFVLFFSVLAGLNALDGICLFFLLGFAIFLFARPFWGFLSLIILRPMIDRWGTQSFGPEALSLNYNSLLGILVVLWGGVLIFQKRKEIRNLPAIIPLALLGVFLLLSALWSISGLDGLREFLRIASIFVLYGAAFLLIREKRHLRQLVYAFLMSACVPLIFGICQFFTGKGETIFGEYFTRLYGTFYYPNSFAFFLVFIIALLFLMFNEAREKLGKFFYVILGIITSFVLLGTYTRGAWMAALIIFFVFGVLKFRRLLLGGALLLILIYLFVPIVQERLGDIISLEPFSSLIWRLRLWTNMLPFFYAKPILGYGLASFQILSQNLQGLSMASVPEAHNDYLRLLIETGVIGLGLYLALYLRLFIFNLKNFFKIKDKFLKDLSLTAVLLVGVFLAVSLGDNILRGTATEWCFWAYLGSVAALTIKKH